MGSTAARVALMSVRPEFASALMDGSKKVEFRKRPLAEDVGLVVVYATLPVGAVVGAFTVAGQELRSPDALWRRHRRHAGISKAGYSAYYDGAETAVGILVGDVEPLEEPLKLDMLGPGLRAPQSFQYLDTSQRDRLRAAVAADRAVRAQRRRRSRRRTAAHRPVVSLTA